MRVTWYLVANASTARILETAKGPKPLTERKVLNHPEARSARKDLKRDRPGMFRQKGARPGAFVEQADARKHELEVFARELASELALGAVLHAYERLVIVAPAPLCALLREFLSPAVQARIVHVVQRDYTKFPDDEVYRLLGRSMLLPAANGA